LIVVNTVLALSGSVVGVFVISSLGFGRGLEMENILNATLAGGVAIGAPCSFIYRPGVALFIGLFTSLISSISFHYLTPYLLKKIKLFDTCGIHNVYGIPGILGGIWSAIIVSFYNTGYDAAIASQYSNGHFLFSSNNSFLKQGGIQIAGTFLSLIFAAFFGLAGGLIASLFYK
jgi:ammonium transporter Rh